MGALTSAVTVALGASAMAGLVRRLLDDTPPVGPMTAAGDEPSRGGLAGTVDRWDPPPPRTPRAAALAAAWAAPLTVVGMAMARLGGTTPRWDAQRACWVATGVGGPSAAILRRLRFDANTIGQVVLALGDDPSDALLDHEAVHVRQCERIGPALPLLYGWWSARHGYRDNPLERGARHGAARRTGTRQG